MCDFLLLGFCDRFQATLVGLHYDQIATVAYLATDKTVTYSGYSLSIHSKHVLEVAQNFHNFQVCAQQT